MLVPVPADSWLEVPTGIVLFLLTAIGFRRGLAKFGPLESWAVFAAVVVLAWPNVWSGERFLLPFLPLVVIFLLSGLDWLGDRLGWRPLVPVFVALLVLANAVQMVSLTRKAVSDNLGYLRGDHYSGYPEDWRSYFQSIDWVKANTSEDAVIMARKPEFVYLLSGRRSFCYPFSQNQDDVKSAMLRSQYILADNFQWTETTPYFLGPVLKANPELWEMAFRTPPPEFYVLRIRTGS
jgi:hypothetical protein